MIEFSEDRIEKIKEGVAKARLRVVQERGCYITPEGQENRKKKLQEQLTPERRERFKQETKKAIILAKKAQKEKADAYAKTHLPIIEKMQRQGLTKLQIADELNAGGYISPRGTVWTDQTVRQVMKRMNKELLNLKDRLDAAETIRKKNSDEFAERLWKIIKPLVERGCNLSEMADILNKKGYTSRRGAPWTHQNVRAILKRLNIKYNNDLAHARMVNNKNIKEFYKKLVPDVQKMLNLGFNLPEIADVLNERGLKSRRGASWNINNVGKIIERIAPSKKINSEVFGTSVPPAPRILGWDK